MSEPLSPHVAELLERVEARVAEAATIEQIRELGEQAMREARNNSLTITEIGELVKVAIDKARQVDALVTRLAELTRDAR